MSIVRAADPSPACRWEFVMPDGKPHEDWHRAEGLAYLLAEHAGRRSADHDTVVDAVDGFEHPDARRIRPGWSGEPFDLHECVQALFQMQSPAEDAELWEAALH